MSTKIRLDALSKPRPPWPAIVFGGFLALSLSYGLARRFQPSIGALWAAGLAALLTFTVYFAILVRLAGAPWRVAVRLAPLYALAMAVAFALLSLIDF